MYEDKSDPQGHMVYKSYAIQIGIITNDGQSK